jgi:hypothetical protein
MKHKKFPESHHIFIVRPRLLTIFYGLFSSLCIIFLGLKTNESMYSMIGLIILAGTSNLLVKFISPAQLILGETRMSLPGHLYGSRHVLFYHELQGFLILQIKSAKYLYLKDKQGKFYDIPTDSIMEWERCLQQLELKVPALSHEERSPATRPWFLISATIFFWSVVFVAVKKGWIEEQSGWLAGAAIVLIVVLAFISGKKK